MAKQKLVITEPSFKLYSKDITKIKTMNTKREREIKALMVNPNTTESEKKKLKDELVSGYLRYVISLAGKFKYTDVPMVDLISEGNMGLMIAIEKFDWTSDFKFSTFARHWIRAQMLMSIYNDARSIRLPMNIAQELHRQMKAFVEENKELEGEYANLPHTIDLFKSIKSDDDESMLLDVIKNKNVFDFEKHIADRNIVDLLLGRCTEREQKVVKLIFGLDGQQQDIKQIAEDMNLNVETIRNIQNKAISKMSK